MNYATIKPFDVANGPGVRVSLFVSGCTHRCEGCFNEEAWDFSFGEAFTEKETEKILEYLRPAHIRGFSLLGGEPFEPVNQKVLCELLEKIKQTYPEKDIWCYTGYTLETDLLSGRLCDREITEKMLRNIDILVDGKFVLALKNLKLRFKGSENQRIIDLQKTLKENKIILWEGENYDS